MEEYFVINSSDLLPQIFNNRLFKLRDLIIIETTFGTSLVRTLFRVLKYSTDNKGIVECRFQQWDDLVSLSAGA